MHCPHSIVLNSRWLMVTLHTRGDYNGSPVPLVQRLNPLRYSITINPGTHRHWTLNDYGKLNVVWANLWWPLSPNNPRWRKRA